MDTKRILEHLFNSSHSEVPPGKPNHISIANGRDKGADRVDLIKGAGAGAAAAGAVALFFGNKGTRKFAKKALKFGGTAALGGLAYKAFNDWQSNSGAGGYTNIGEPINSLPRPQAFARSEAIIMAMISAARIDGHIDESEQIRITDKIAALGLEQDVTQFLLREMNQPIDPDRIAALADSPEAAAEMYLVSAMLLDYEIPMERAYLDQLAKAMSLPPEIVSRLDEQLLEERDVA